MARRQRPCAIRQAATAQRRDGGRTKATKQHHEISGECPESHSIKQVPIYSIMTLQKGFDLPHPPFPPVKFDLNAAASSTLHGGSPALRSHDPNNSLDCMIHVA